MDAQECYDFINNKAGRIAQTFYGDRDYLSLGRGLIYNGILYPLYVEEENRFRTLEGLVYVLSHECDVDQNNVRAYNDDILVCPMTPLENVVEVFGDKDNELKSFLGHVAKGRMSRLMWFPRIAGVLEYGAMVFWNQICGTKVQVFNREGAEKVAALSFEGLYAVESALREHFLRPKVQVPGVGGIAMH
jgi:hypothetical protein